MSKLIKALDTIGAVANAFNIIEPMANLITEALTIGQSTVSINIRGGNPGYAVGALMARGIGVVYWSSGWFNSAVVVDSSDYNRALDVLAEAGVEVSSE